MFANTYVCESTLSTIKQVKSENVNRMVYETVDHSIHFAPLTQWRNHMLLRHHFWHISQHIANVMVRKSIQYWVDYIFIVQLIQMSTAVKETVKVIHICFYLV